jgi:hypothetical protein
MTQIVVTVNDQVAQLLEILGHNSEGRGFDFWRCHYLNLSDCTMALGSTQPLTGTDTMKFSWGVKMAGA